MRIKNSIYILLLTFLITEARAQDMHWTMFDMSPLTLNPAYSGDHDKALRAGINYRGQWNAISNVSGFKTSSAFIDAPIITAGRSSWLGLGLVLFNDSSGINRLSNRGAAGSIAVHLKTGRNSVLALGFQGRFVNRRFDTDNLLFEEQINITGPDQAFTSSVNNGLFADNTSLHHADAGFGLKYYTKLSKTSELTLGSAINRFASRNNFLEGQRLPLLFTLHGRLALSINRQWSFLPGFIYYQAGNARQVNLQTLVRFQTRSRQAPFGIRTGLSYRAVGNDALAAVLQLDFNAYRLGLAYDINISDLAAASNNRGGVELSFIYISGPKKSFKSKVVCPTAF